MSADLRGRKDLGSVIGYAYRLYARNFASLFALGLITAPMQLLIVVVERRIEDEAVEQAVVGLLNVPALLFAIVALGALIYAANGIVSGGAPDAGAALDAAFGRFVAILTSVLLAAAMILLSLLAFPALAVAWVVRRDFTIDGRRDWWLVLPGVLPVYLVVRWQFLSLASVIDGKARWSALDTSADAVRGQWWRTLGIIGTVTLIQLGIVGLAGVAEAGPPLLEASVVALLAAFVLPFAVLAQTLLYYDLKARMQHDDIDPATA